MTPLLSFDAPTKARYLARVATHREADELIHGVGWENGKGCAVGCTLDAYDHARYPIELGIPTVLAHLEDALFEGLPPGRAQTWPEDFLRAVPTDTDLWRVWPRFAVWLLTVECPSPSGAAVAALYQRRLDGDEPSTDTWAASAARAERAERAASAAERAASAAAWAESAAAWAAWATWAASAARAERAERAERAARASYTRQADYLLRILATAERTAP